MDWPIWTPPPGTADEEAAWVTEGRNLRDLIQAELGEQYEVSFET